MKQKDIVLILIMVFISAVAAFAVSRSVFGSPGNREQSTAVVEVITPEFSPPPTKYFNTNSINPTQLITIGGDPNPSPFDNQAD